MKKHCNSFEQYCYILDKNVIMEEHVFHNGQKVLKCASFQTCSKKGGCTNRIVKKFIVDVKNHDACQNIPV